MNRVAIAILAAGASSRMGQPKQLLSFRGKSLLRRSVDTALQTDCGPVVVVLGSNAERITPELDGLPVTVVLNAEWDHGPGTSVRAAVKHLESDSSVTGVVFLLCDQPFVDVHHMRKLIAASEATRLPMVASGYGGTCGVPALFDRSCFKLLRTLNLSVGAKQVLNRNFDAVALVPFPNGEVDLDTPADYARYEEKLHVAGAIS